MRQIKFRGKAKNGNKWVYGFLLKTKDKDDVESSWIKEEGDFTPFKEDVYLGISDFCDFFEVEPETVGQFTGLQDKCGREIYEGDIVLKNILTEPVRFKGTYWRDCSIEVRYSNQSWIPHALNESKIIGNIHQNSDLLNN